MSKITRTAAAALLLALSACTTATGVTGALADGIGWDHAPATAVAAAGDATTVSGIAGQMNGIGWD